MLKNSVFSLMIILLVFTFPLSSLASTVPDQVRQGIEHDLQNQQLSIAILLNQDQHEQAIHTDHNNKNILGDGYARYSLKNLTTVQNDTYATNVLQFNGYLFIIEDKSGSKAIAYADKAPNYDTITHLASDSDFSDQSFKDPLEQAKKLIGYTSESKLIDDESHHIVALVTPQDGLDQVVFIKNSMLLNMHQFDVISFKEFMVKIRQAEAKQAKLASSSDEPLSGGGAAYSEEHGQRSTSTSAEQNLFLHPLFWKIGLIIIVVIAVMYHLTRRKRKHRL